MLIHGVSHASSAVSFNTGAHDVRRALEVTSVAAREDRADLRQVRAARVLVERVESLLHALGHFGEAHPQVQDFARVAGHHGVLKRGLELGLTLIALRCRLLLCRAVVTLPLERFLALLHQRILHKLVAQVRDEVHAALNDRGVVHQNKPFRNLLILPSS